jgi:hypothetical protein
MPRRRTVSWLVLVLAFGPATAAAEDRKPVPPTDARAAAEQLINELFKDDYAKAKKSAAAKSALAETLFKEGEATKDDQAARFMLFREARDLAAAGGDLQLALRAADTLAAEYALSGPVQKAEVLEKINPATATDARAAAELALWALDQAVAADEYEAAARILKAAQPAARKAQSVALVNQVQQRAKELNELKAAYAKAQAAQKTLQTNPDAEAHLTVGKYVCFVNGAWEKGLPSLAKGSDAKLKALAEKDLEAPTASAEQVELADGWYDVAAGETARLQLQLRAAHWYKEALPRLTGLTRTRVEKRLDELETAIAATSGRAKLFAEIRKLVAAKRVKKWNIVGGAFTRETFEDVPPEGAILIGFRYTTASNGEYPGMVQPIYLTARGEVYGKKYGEPEKGAKVMEAKARPGYAVGALYTRGGGGFDAFKPIFMRMTDRGLNVNDKYEGPHVGGKGGGEGTLGGDGHFIVGLHGKVNKDGKMEAMSAVSLSPPKRD